MIPMNELQAAHKQITELEQRIKELEALATQRGARMQIMREWMVHRNAEGDTQWDDFLLDYGEAAGWFDADGVPKCQ